MRPSTRTHVRLDVLQRLPGYGRVVKLVVTQDMDKVDREAIVWLFHDPGDQFNRDVRCAFFDTDTGQYLGECPLPSQVTPANTMGADWW